MKSEFELRSLEMLLQRLLEDSIIKDEVQKKKLYKLYSNDNRDFSQIHEEIKRLRYDSKFLLEKLKQDEIVIDKQAYKIDTTKKAEYPLSLDCIEDFTKDGNSYIKIHYPAPSDKIRIVENTTNPYKSGKEIFESLKDTQKLMGLDGDSNVTSIFEQVLLQDRNEIIMQDVKELSKTSEFSKLSNEEKEIVFGTLKTILSSLNVSDDMKKRLNSENVEMLFQMLDEKIYISPQRNIIVRSIPNEIAEDKVSELKYTVDYGVKNYSLEPLNEKTNKIDMVGMNEDVLENGSSPVLDEDGNNLDGPAYTKIPSWKKKKNGQAAFVSVLWIAMLMGILTLCISIAILVNN